MHTLFMNGDSMGASLFWENHRNILSNNWVCWIQADGVLSCFQTIKILLFFRTVHWFKAEKTVYFPLIHPAHFRGYTVCVTSLWITTSVYISTSQKYEPHVAEKTSALVLGVFLFFFSRRQYMLQQSKFCLLLVSIKYNVMCCMCLNHLLVSLAVIVTRKGLGAKKSQHTCPPSCFSIPLSTGSSKTEN